MFWISSKLTTSTGIAESSGVPLMNEPVMITSSSEPAALSLDALSCATA
jgi:hypothetical protein